MRHWTIFVIPTDGHHEHIPGRRGDQQHRSFNVLLLQPQGIWGEFWSRFERRKVQSVQELHEPVHGFHFHTFTLSHVHFHIGVRLSRFERRKNSICAGAVWDGAWISLSHVHFHTSLLHFRFHTFTLSDSHFHTFWVDLNSKKFNLCRRCTSRCMATSPSPSASSASSSTSSTSLSSPTGCLPPWWLAP